MSEDDSSRSKRISLAILDLFSSPVEEFAEILTDQLRFYRWRSALWIAERAKEIREEKGIPKKRVPIKLLLPLLEEGSKEDEDSEMIELWANLLADADSSHNSFDLMCIDYLRNLTAHEAIILKAIGEVYSEEKGGTIVRIIDTLQERLTSRFPGLEITHSTGGNRINLGPEDLLNFDIKIEDCLQNDLKLLWSNCGFISFREHESRVFDAYNFEANEPSYIALQKMGLIGRRHVHLVFHRISDDHKFGIGLSEDPAPWTETTKGVLTLYVYSLSREGQLLWQKVSGQNRGV